MESLVASPVFWKNKRVFVTGHTGFKGGWLCHWLKQMGCVVGGYSLAPPSTPNLFEVALIKDGLEHVHGDLRNAEALTQALISFQPEIIFHMAAQALVRYSYDEPGETFGTNIMGSLNLLEAVRATSSVRAVVYITTDKCYENKEWIWPYRENEPLGGKDPYSASKACAEILAGSYTHSFFNQENSPRLATVRAGNVIGGGDWGLDRLLPDMMRAFAASDKVTIRNPAAIRPWQHVLEALSGYLMLAEKLYGDDGRKFVGPYNLGPDQASDGSVLDVVRMACKYWGSDAEYEALKTHDGPHEAKYLRLDSSKAKYHLGWRPALLLPQTLLETVKWYRLYYDGGDVRALMTEQIKTVTGISPADGSQMAPQEK